MKKKTAKSEPQAGLRREHHLPKRKGAVRGKYPACYRAGTFSYPGNANLRLAFRTGTNLVLLSPDVAEYFPDEQSVNTALRTLIHAAKGPLRRAYSAVSKSHVVGNRRFAMPRWIAPLFALQ